MTIDMIKLNEQLEEFLKLKDMTVSDLFGLSHDEFGLLLGRFSEKYGYSDEDLKSFALSFFS